MQVNTLRFIFLGFVGLTAILAMGLGIGAYVKAKNNEDDHDSNAHHGPSPSPPSPTSSPTKSPTRSPTKPPSGSTPSTKSPTMSPTKPPSGPAPPPSPEPKPTSTCSIPPFDTIKVKDPDYTDPICKPSPTISIHDIPKAWKAAGMNMKYCPDALIIASGECQDIAGDVSLCGPGYSGIWQVDSDSTDSSNPCDNAVAAYEVMHNNCYNNNIPGLRFKGAPPGGSIKPETCKYYGNSDQYYYTTGGNPDGNCNWIGPFCHWQLPGPNSVKEQCCSWSGGANSYQPQGFPYYYYRELLKKAKMPINNIPKCNNCPKGQQPKINVTPNTCPNNSTTCVTCTQGDCTNNHCDELEQKALQTATNICMNSIVAQLHDCESATNHPHINCMSKKFMNNNFTPDLITKDLPEFTTYHNECNNENKKWSSDSCKNII